MVAECVARLASGREIWLPIRAGVDTAEWAWERPDVRGRVRHARPPVHASFPDAARAFTGHQYLGVLRLPGRFAVALAALPGLARRPAAVARAGGAAATPRPAARGRRLRRPRPT